MATVEHAFSRTTNALRVTGRDKTYRDLIEGSLIHSNDHPEEEDIPQEHLFLDVGDMILKRSALIKKYQSDFASIDQTKTSESVGCTNETGHALHTCYDCDNMDTARRIQQHESQLALLTDHLNSARGIECEEQNPQGLLVNTNRDFHIKESIACQTNISPSIEPMCSSCSNTSHVEKVVRSNESRLRNLESRLHSLKGFDAESSFKPRSTSATQFPDIVHKSSDRKLSTADWLKFHIGTAELLDEIDRQLIEYQRSAHKPKAWTPKITVPKPFAMTIREDTRPNEMSSKERLIREAKEREKCEFSKFKSQPIPATTVEPLYEKLTREKVERREKVHAERLELLKSSEKPFSFYNRPNTNKVDGRHANCLIVPDTINW